MKTILKILLVSLFFALIAMGLISCGARKVSKQASKEETKSEVVDNSVTEKKIDTNVKTTTTVKVDDKNETVTEETTYSPSNPEKESFVIEKDGTKVILNNVNKTVKKTTQKNNTQTNKVQNSETTQNNAFKEQKDVKQVNTSIKKENSKQVDKKQFNPFVLIISIIGVLFLLYLIYWLYKKFMLL